MERSRSGVPGGKETTRGALRLVLLIGVVSLFADLTYEGSRSIVGQYLAVLGASATVVGIVAGFGELLGYALRLVSARLSEKTGQFWPITLVGYAIQMSSVPLLALAGTWQLAAVLIVLERVGKAIRNPPRGSGSLLFGQLFDRAGISILIPLTLVASPFAPLVFLGGFWTALLGCILWGVGMGVHESIVPAAVALMAPVLRRSSAYGLFTAGYGVFWFLGSAVMGILYDVSLPALIVFCVAAELASLPFFLLVWRQGLPRGQTAT